VETILRPVYQERSGHPDTLGIILMEDGTDVILTSLGFEAVLLIVVNKAEQPVFVEHYHNGEKNAVLFTVTRDKIREWMNNEKNEPILHWLNKGKVLFERNDFMNRLKEEMNGFPASLRKEKLAQEFSKVIYKFFEGKTLFDKEKYLDAFKFVVESLNHLGRMAIIEKGWHSEPAEWQQVRKAAPEISKLYEELITSNESLDKRLQLFFLAGGFYIHAKTESGVQYFLEVLREKEQWTINEMYSHEKLNSYFPEFCNVLEYLIEKNFVKIISEEAEENNTLHRYYRVHQA